MVRIALLVEAVEGDADAFRSPASICLSLTGTGSVNSCPT